jgi:FkbM family methyltransferase
MPADSAARRLTKRALAPLLNDAVYGWVHAASIARDIRAGRYAEPELDLVPLAVKRGETVLDLGANLGMYLPALSRAVGPPGRVCAFEPIPYTAATLRKVKALLRLQNVEIVPRGCAEHDARVAFRVPVQDSGALSTGQAHMERRNDHHPGEETQVRWSRNTLIEADVVALDSYLAGQTQISLIKADIEGAELYAFEGAAGLIERDRPTVICEINPWFLEGFGIQLTELLAFFSASNYRLYEYRGQDRRLAPVADLAGLEEDNYVFVHPSRLDRLAPILSPVPAAP